MVHNHHLERGVTSHCHVVASQSQDLHGVRESQMLSMVEVVIRPHHRDDARHARVGHHDDVGPHLHDEGTHFPRGAHLYADLGHHHHVNVIAVQSTQPRRHLTGKYLWLIELIYS